MFDWIEVWGSTWPIKNVNVVRLEQIHRQASSMRSCIVMLKMEYIVITLGKEGENNRCQYVITISPGIQCPTNDQLICFTTIMNSSQTIKLHPPNRSFCITVVAWYRSLLRRHICMRPSANFNVKRDSSVNITTVLQSLLSHLNGTVPTQSTLTGTTTLPPCSDHDNRCSQASYKNLLCNPNAVPDTKKYAIETCPLTCNYCTEYYATVTCNICGDLAGRIPCSQSLVFKNITTTTTCPSSQQYCMTDVLQDSSGNKDIFKRCVDEATCRTKWLTESADQDYCSKYDVVKNPNAFECHFCCHGDYCNTGIKPKDSVLVQKQSGK
ncbi:Hypothetical predicted protein [Mytilus galloprovincialis]|uniref:ShKT domain-containing protein n=1 Tax=Mytilus galloprovincialis TaxID=29158 RepID=A0A8B6BRF1_MYTGA|nr:Hypothetical predicted protein [Mytilus galloprovincialis]